MSQDASPLGNSFAPPPAAFPATPRSVRLRSRPYILGTFVLFLAILAFGLCPVTLLPLVMKITARWFGTETTGAVTDKQARGNRRLDHVAIFEFQIAGETYASEVHVDRA